MPYAPCIFRLDAPQGGGPSGDRRRSLPRIPVYNPEQSPGRNYDPDEESDVFSNAEMSPWSPISPWQQPGTQPQQSNFNFEPGIFELHAVMNHYIHNRSLNQYL